jgi:hypothetical protein
MFWKIAKGSNEISICQEKKVNTKTTMATHKKAAQKESNRCMHNN